MSKVKSITTRFEQIFKQCKGLDNSNYEKVIMNVELLKKKYFNLKFKKNDKDLFEVKSFSEFIKTTHYIE